MSHAGCRGLHRRPRESRARRILLNLLGVATWAFGPALAAVLALWWLLD